MFPPWCSHVSDKKRLCHVRKRRFWGKPNFGDFPHLGVKLRQLIALISKARPS